MIERTKKVRSWRELVDFVESINPYNETLVLSGWINEFYAGHTYVKELLFTTKPATIMVEENVRKPKKVVAKPKVKDSTKQRPTVSDEDK